MTDNTFSKIGDSKQRMFGPRALLMCGYPADEHSKFLVVLEKINMGDVPVVFASEDMVNGTLKEAFSLEHKHGFEKETGLERAVVMSGLTEMELKTLMTAHRHLPIPRPLWATLTPTSENWTVSDLLKELAAEREAIADAQRRRDEKE